MRPPNGRGQRETLDKVPPFLLKLYEIVENNSVPPDGSRPCVSWGPDGKSFVIHETETFARNILPLYFKHDNIRSFMRQLNIYSFTRCPKKANSTGNPNAVEFSHPSFIRGCMHLLSEFKRLVTSGSKAKDAGSHTTGGNASSAQDGQEMSVAMTAPSISAQAPGLASGSRAVPPPPSPSFEGGGMVVMAASGAGASAADGGGGGGGGGTMSVGVGSGCAQLSSEAPGQPGTPVSSVKPGPTINALRDEVLTLKDSIAHLEAEMLHHTSVTRDHMKKLASLIVSFQETPSGPLGAGPLGTGSAQAAQMAAQFAQPVVRPMGGRLEGGHNVGGGNAGGNPGEMELAMAGAGGAYSVPQGSQQQQSSLGLTGGTGGTGGSNNTQGGNSSQDGNGAAHEWQRNVYL